jgi:uncharacterized protein (TIGR00369 family)
MPSFEPLTFPSSMPGFDTYCGLVIDSIDEDALVHAHLDVEDHHKQPAGLVHGGVLTTIAESVASIGTAVFVMPGGQTAQGLGNHTSFLRPVLGSRIEAVARPRHRGRTTWVWDVEMLDDHGRLCALARMTVAVRGDTSDAQRDAG